VAPVSCPICEKRPPKRFCPAKGEKICPLCCGRGREVTIDCPIDCPHLIAAHRYEREHAKPIGAEDLPYRDVQVRPNFVYERWDVIAGFAEAILQFQIQNNELNDSSTAAALEALAEKYRALGAGIYYEREPASLLARALYGQLNQFLQEFRKQRAARIYFAPLQDDDIFQLLVFLLRAAKHETNGRPRSRAFLDFLRANFPPSTAPTKEASRIVLP
jgi:hypothetical protein